jgi:hypothetical protein
MTAADEGEGRQGAPGAGHPALPEASLSLLIAGLATQAQVALGLRANPITNETKKDLAAARRAIGLLDVLEAKTKGNLDDAERRLLGAALADLRLAYVRLKDV